MKAVESEFLDHLYSASIGAGGWSDALSAYLNLVGGHTAVAIAADMSTGNSFPVEWLNIDAEHVRTGLSMWQAKDPWIASSRATRASQPDRFRKGLVVRGSEKLSPSDLLGSEWYNEYGIHALAQDCMSTIGICNDRYMLVLSAQTGGHPPTGYDDGQQRVAEQLLPHVHRALDLQIRAGTVRNRSHAEQRFPELTVPVLTLAGRRILASNPAAMRELDLGRIVRRSQGKVWGHDDALDRMISLMARSDAPRQSVMTVTAVDGSRFLVQAIRFNQLRGTLMEAAGADDPAVTLILTELSSFAAGREKAIEAMRLFTPAEQVIAVALLNGQGADDIARDRRKSVETIRWHIRNMVDKAGCSGAQGLTRLLSLLLPT